MRNDLKLTYQGCQCIGTREQGHSRLEHTVTGASACAGRVLLRGILSSGRSAFSA